MTDRHTTTLARDLEGTVISHASTMIPRPGLFNFLLYCRQHFERIVFFSFVEKERGRQILQTMADQGHMPEWVRTADYFHAEGGRPGAKDLRQLGVDPEQALLVDDQPQVLPREQLHRLVQVPEFKEPYHEDNLVLAHVQKVLQQGLQRQNTLPSHLKLIGHDPLLNYKPYADYYRFGEQSADCPLIVYTGGAISHEEYEKRFHTEPLPIMREFATAFAGSGLMSADLVILPFFPDPDGTIYQQLFSVLIFEFLRQTGNPRPANIGCIGFSLGASFASYLTFSLPQVKALAVLGGYGMSEGANESRMVGKINERCYQAWWNADSDGYMENLFFLHLLTRHDAGMEIITGSGGHAFADYAVNGSVREAFTFVLSNLGACNEK